MNKPGKSLMQRSTSWALVVYVLFLASLLIPVTALLGLLMAWLNYDEAEPWQQSHHRYQIRTMLAALAGVLLGVSVLLYVSTAVGAALVSLAVIWLIVRCIAGLIFLQQKKAHPNPSGWGFR